MTVSATGSGGAAVLGTVFGGTISGAVGSGAVDTGAVGTGAALAFTGGSEIAMLLLLALVAIAAGMLFLGLARRHRPMPAAAHGGSSLPHRSSPPS